MGFLILFKLCKGVSMNLKNFKEHISFFMVMVCVATFWYAPKSYADNYCYEEENSCGCRSNWWKNNGLVLGGALIVGAAAGAIAGCACKKSSGHKNRCCHDPITNNGGNGGGGDLFEFDEVVISYLPFNLNVSEGEVIIQGYATDRINRIQFGSEIETAGAIFPTELAFPFLNRLNRSFDTGIRILVPAHTPPITVTVGEIIETISSVDEVLVNIQLTPGRTFTGSETGKTTFEFNTVAFP